MRGTGTRQRQVGVATVGGKMKGVDCQESVGIV